MDNDWSLFFLLFIRSLHLTYQVHYTLTTLGYTVAPAVKMELFDVPNSATLKYNEYHWFSRESHDHKKSRRPRVSREAVLELKT